MNDEQDQGKSGSRGLRSVGDALGGWARRVGELVAEVSGAPSVPEELREPLTQARLQRLAGDQASAQATLRVQVEAHPGQPHLRFALGLTFVHDLMLGGRPLRPLADVIAALEDDALGPAPRQLLAGAHDLFDGRPEAALDALRRARRHVDEVPRADVQETRLCLHLLTGFAQLQRGEQDRALREFHAARAQLLPELGLPLRRVLLREGIALLLACDHTAEAERWIEGAQVHDPNDPLARELHVRVLAAKGDALPAQAQLEALGEEPALDATRLLVGVTVGLPDDGGDDLEAVARRHLQAGPHEPEHRRRWALAELIVRGDDLADGPRMEVITALSDAAAAAPAAVRDRWLAELAHVALRLDWFPPPVCDPLFDRLRREEGTAPEELRLVRARHRIASNDPSSEDFQPGAPPRFRADPDLGGPAGPDPYSPLRDPDRRSAVLASQRALAAAERCHLDGQDELAQELLVEALIEAPRLPRARRMLAQMAQGAATRTRLEDRLSAATTLLAGIPNRILGVSLAGVQAAMVQVIAARERLARPLTIAIMGEFSAGKSTFVNALLGQAVAPMGVLPTTSTINVFRRGPSGGARVHYRDGRISTLAPEDVESFLHGLDDGQAARIRHVEIERTGGRFGEAAVVDTPGLNALDSFHEQVAREFLDEADAVVWLFSATRSGAATEAGMLSSLRAGGRQVLGVLNKVDTLDDDERVELAEYLRTQLGEVLVEVVPLCARDALEHRRAGSDRAGDPFAAVEDALERHFLQRARELKRGLTERRLGEALAAAHTSVVEAVTALEQQADAALAGTQGERIAAHPLLLRFGEALEVQLLGVDDLLTREGLSLGVLVPGKGRAKGPLDSRDEQYLAASFREGTMAALRRALAPLGREDPAAALVLDEQLVPWAQGHVEGLLQAGLLSATLRDHGSKIADGEAAMRSGFRDALRPVAKAWAARARQLAREVERTRARLDREASSAPRAEALRLRSAVLTAIDGLAEASAEANAEEPPP